MSRKVAVIGSGPSSVAAIAALIQTDAAVTVFDFGMSIESQKKDAIAALGNKGPLEWTQNDLRAFDLTESSRRRHSVLKKYVFGSDYIYQESNPRCLTTSSTQISASPSLALGGFSQAWVGALLPSNDLDLSDWPFSTLELDNSYREVLKLLPYSATIDAINDYFPLYKDPDGLVSLSDQSEKFLSNLSKFSLKFSSKFPDKKLVFGRSRLAIAVKNIEAQQTACKYCGHCLSGCAYGSIHTFDAQIRQWIKLSKIRYVSNAFVDSLTEFNNGKSVLVKWFYGNEDHLYSQEFDRVYVGAGALNSTRLMLKSNGVYNEDIIFSDSQKFILPIITSSTSKFEWPKINSFSSVFMELLHKNNWAHMQITGTNDHLIRLLGLDAPPGGLGLKLQLLRPFLARLFTAWCGIHSRHSHSFSGRLIPERSSDRFHLTELINPTTHEIIQEIAYNFFKTGFAGGLLFLPTPIIGKIGGGNHYGSSLPMKKNPATKFDSDSLGRPFGHNSIHVIDSSVMPSIPGTTMALTMMANAHRIASTSIS